METIKMKLSDMRRPDRNIRIHGEKQLVEYEKSVMMFGQIRPIVVDENNTIMAGLGLYETLLRMGWEEADIYIYDSLTDNQKKKLMIADNKIFSLGIENLDTLNQFFDELQDDLEIPGYDTKVLQQMVADVDEITEIICEYGIMEEGEVQSIRESAEKREKAVIQGQSGMQMESVTQNNQEEPEKLLDRSLSIEKPYVICTECGVKVWL